ncbi:glycosyl hydrolase family 85-domain-containing protein [Delphinella strobiligena]|nr:glycosyl hydrolase family 85-domain-containing protein [Delphinella strobiligena]
MAGWKDILRPIRDGLRDQIPSRPPKEDKDEAEKRRRQRESDILKGFAYFDTFDEVESWTPKSVDPLQRANTPLLSRSPHVVRGQSTKAKVILIHDYAGNYHDYEACQGSEVVRESYACNHMQYIDTFVYFSHKLVCIPPPTWTNTLHRNGVKSLGTFLVEPQSVNIGKILERRPSTTEGGGWECPLATQLAKMAESYGFDGWLLNIEKTFPYAQWGREKMVGFISQLRSRLGHGNVIWYDALTVNNTLQYQNALTSQNLEFAQAAGTLLTNYDWTPEKAAAAKALALTHTINPSDIVFGIDVWAQNSPSQGNLRRTYGGGGTRSGTAVRKLAGLGLSAGIFAPAWPYEHFPTSSVAVEESMWYGEKLPERLECDCVPANMHDIYGYQERTITRFAQEYPAGSESFFYTNFERAFSSKSDSGVIAAHLGSASVLPRMSNAYQRTAQGQTQSSLLRGNLQDEPARVTVSLTPHIPRGPISAGLELFLLSMTGDVEARIVYRKPKTPDGLSVAILGCGVDEQIKVPSEACERVEIRRIFHCTRKSLEEARPSLNRKTATKGLQGIQVVVEGEVSEADSDWPLDLIELLEICMKRPGAAYRRYRLAGFKLCGTRLSWTFHVDKDDESTNDEDLPYSSITGPFPYFLIFVDGDMVGRAYGIEYLLSTEMATRLNGNEKHQVEVRGFAFDSSFLCSVSELEKHKERIGEDGGWQLV